MDKTWEYRIIWVGPEFGNDSWNSVFNSAGKMLNQAGLEGWDLCGLSGDKNLFCWTMRREIKPVKPYR